MNENIGDSGVANTRNPAYLTNKYQPFNTSPRRVNVGNYFKTDSQYDETLGDVSGAIEEGLTVDDLRAKKQSNFQRLGNALINNVVIAGTTAAGGILGLADGLLEAAYEGEVNRLWDNKVNNAVADIQEKTREAFPIYRGREYEDMSTLERLGTGIFWADLVQTLGFTEGMIIPGMGAAKLVSSAPKLLQKVVPSLTAAISEAATEAINTKNDEVQNKTLMANQRYNELAQGAVTPFALNVLDQEYRKDIEGIEEDARKAGNFVFGANIALLTLSNAIQFDKLFSRGFSTANRINGALKREGKGLTSKYYTDSLAKEIAKTTGKKLTDALSEGFEELSQSVISSTPQNFKDFNSFNDSKFNPDKRETVSNLINALGQTFSETLGDKDAWTEFASGFLIGALGVPMLKKGKIPVTLENNIGKEIYDTYKDWQEKSRFADEVNNRLQDNPKINTYYEGLVGHLAQQDRMNVALDREDTFEFKNAESAQFINDVQMFDEAGDIDNLKQIVNESVDLSDEGINNIIESTSTNGEGPFMQNGNKMSIEEVRQNIQEKIDYLNSRIDSYIEDKQSILQVAPSISDNALKTALYYKQQLRDSKDRLDSVTDEVYSSIVNLLQTENNKPKPKKKIQKGEGVYIKNEQGKKVLVHKDDIDYYDEEGNAILKKKEIDIPSKQDFTKLWFTDRDFSTKLQDLLSDNSSEIPYDQRLKTAKQLNDLNRLFDVVPQYSKNLAEIILNPDKADELIEKSTQRIQEDYDKKRKDSIKSILSSATTPQQLQGIIQDLSANDAYAPYIQETLDEIKNDNSSSIKNIVKDYDDIQKYKESLDNVISEVQDNNLKQSLSNIVADAINNAANIQDIKTSLNEAINKLPKEYSDEVKKMLDQVENNISSKKASQEADTNQPEKKLKRRKLNIPTSMDDVAAMQQPKEDSKDKDVQPDNSNPLGNKSREELERIAKTSDSQIEKKLAEKQLEVQQLPKVGQKAEGTNSEQDIPQKDSKEPYLRSWIYTKYNINDLKNRDIRRATINNEGIVQSLDALGAYDFVDEGKLGILFNNNNDIPIYYVKVTNDSNLEDTIILAIEVTDEVASLVSTNTAFVAQDGKKYQAVGALGFDKNNNTAVEGYNNIVRSFNSEYLEYTKNNSTPTFFVSKNTNRIKHFYSGRMVKTTDETAPRQKSLSELTQNPILGVYYSNVIHAPLLDDEIVVPLNRNNPNDLDGSVWLISREADGRYYTKAVKVRLFNEEEYDTKAHSDSPIYKHIIEDLAILIDETKDDRERQLAKFDLMTLLYIPEENQILFSGENVSINNYINNIGKGLNKEDKLVELLKTIQSLNLRFQVIPSRLADESYVKELLDSDILTTDLAKVNNVNASFDIYINPEQVDDSARTGHTGQQGINNAIHSENYTINGITYSIFPNNIIKVDNDVVTDQNRIDEVLFKREISVKKLKPLEGTGGLYISNYSSNTSGEQQFGIFRGKVITGKELEDMLGKHTKAIKKETKQDAVDSMFTTVTAQQSLLSSIYDTAESIEDSSGDIFVTAEGKNSLISQLYGTAESESKEESTDTIPDISDIPLDLGEILPEEKTKPNKPVGIIGEQFDAKSIKTSKELKENKGKFTPTSKDNRAKMREIGISNIEELKKIIEERKLQKLETITTTEEFDELLSNIVNCPKE